MVGVARLAQVFAVLRRVSNDALVERPEMGGRKAERVRSGEVVEVLCAQGSSVGAGQALVILRPLAE